MFLDNNHFFLTCAPEVREVCKPLTKHAIPHFSYTKVYPNGHRIYLTTHPLLLQQYFHQQYYRIGHCEHQPKVYKPQKLLWSTLPQQRIFEQTHTFNIGEGLFIVRPRESYSEFFNFACDLEQRSGANFFLNRLELINQFIDKFMMQASDLIQRAEKINMILPLQTTHFLANDPEDRAYTWQMLAPQQQKCAHYLLRGFTTKRIAKAMGLSPRTIETYVNHLKQKLKAASKSGLLLELVKLK